MNCYIDKDGNVYDLKELSSTTYEVVAENLLHDKLIHIRLCDDVQNIHGCPGSLIYKLCLDL